MSAYFESVNIIRSNVSLNRAEWKYPPAKPGALGREPLKAAGMGR
jgi:hypothetical protein